MKQLQMDNKIDAVITWVDGNDTEWQAQKLQYMSAEQKKASYNGGTAEARYRSWDNLQYVFRSIETFMPWIHKVYLVTWGHLPEWLNTSHEKLCVVNHKDYIPKEYLPTFNSNVIELNFDKINGLSEQFLYFNDDCFVIGPTKPGDFFVNGVPRDTAALTPFIVTRNGIAASEMNNLEIVNTYFSRDNITRHFFKWINPLYGEKAIRTLFFLLWKNIIGIYEPHVSLGLLKSTYKELWEREQEVLDSTCKNRFRTKNDVSFWVLRHWQLLTGKFWPRAVKFTRYTVLPNDLGVVLKLLEKPGRCRLLCINDSLSIENFEEIKLSVNTALERLLPNKSNFEL